MGATLNSDRWLRQKHGEGAQAHLLPVGTDAAATLKNVCHSGASAGLAGSCGVLPGMLRLIVVLLQKCSKPKMRDSVMKDNVITTLGFCGPQRVFL